MKAVCLLSGGMDSSTLAYLARDKGYDIAALHINYGQRTEQKELACAKKIAELLSATDFIEISLDYLGKRGLGHGGVRGGPPILRGDHDLRLADACKSSRRARCEGERFEGLFVCAFLCATAV